VAAEPVRGAKLAKPRFEEVLLEAIDKCLGSLGESSRTAVYFYLRRDCKIRSADLWDSVEAFTQALESIFGLGADYPKDLTLRILSQKADGNVETLFEQTDFSQALLTVTKELEC
jgi:hypothetical protein